MLDRRDKLRSQTKFPVFPTAYLWLFVRLFLFSVPFLEVVSEAGSRRVYRFNLGPRANFMPRSFVYSFLFFPFVCIFFIID